MNFTVKTRNGHRDTTIATRFSFLMNALPAAMQDRASPSLGFATAHPAFRALFTSFSHPFFSVHRTSHGLFQRPSSPRSPRTTSLASELDAQALIFHPKRVILRRFCIFLFLLTSAFAQPLTASRLSCEVENNEKATILTAKIKGTEAFVKFRIDWASEDKAPEKFQNQSAKPDRLTSSHRLGKTTLTRTILVSETADCIFIHILADQPGAVHFAARFVSEDPIEIHDRRQIILSGKQIHAHAWVIPFESDVSDDGKTITLSGEGEALILLNLATDTKKHSIANTFSRLGDKYDPGHTPPDPHLIWEGVQKTQEEKK